MKVCRRHKLKIFKRVEKRCVFPKRSMAWMAAAVFALMGCAAPGAVNRGADQARVPVQDPATGEYASCFKNASFDIDFDRPWRKPGPPGISAKTVFSLRLSLKQTCPMKLEPEKLTARIGPLTYRFAVENDNKFFSTKNLIVAERDLETGPVPVEIDYRSPHSVVTIPTGKTVFVDTKKPKAPVLSIEGCGPKLFNLRWTASDEDGVKYAVKKFDHGSWVKLPPGELTSLKKAIEKKHKGWVRVEAMDRAGNASISNEIELICDPIEITSMKIFASDGPTWKGAETFNDKIVTNSNFLHSGDAYAIEVTSNKPGRLILVNVDARGFGFRLYPTKCRTGYNFDDKIYSSIPKRYPFNNRDGIYYLQLDDITGKEEIYAIVCKENYEEVKAKIWEWVKNEICSQKENTIEHMIKGTRELPGSLSSNTKRKTDKFEKSLNDLVRDYNDIAIKKQVVMHQ